MLAGTGLSRRLDPRNEYGFAMTTAATPETVVTTPNTGAHRWRKLRFGLLVLAMGIAAGAVLLGTAPSTFTDLKAGIVAGRVDELRIVGALPRGATGYARVVMFWRDQNRDRYAEVIQLSDVAALPPSQFPETEHVIGSLEDPLRALHGSLQIVPDHVGQSGSFVAGWQVPGWLLLTALLTWGATLLLLFNGAEPWWATRWAWFWAFFSPVAIIAVPLFLLLSGPPPGIPHPAQPGRRLTGGWAFLLVAALGPAFAHVASVGV